MTDDNRENQLFELEALESVLRENKLTKMSDWTDERSEIEGSVEVSFDLISDPSAILEGKSDAGEKFSVPLDILPPVRLNFRFPRDYPNVSSPQLSLESDWMTKDQKEACEAEMATICKENQMMPVLFFCYQAVIDHVDAMPTKVINLNEAYALKNDGETIESLKKKLLGKGEEAAEEHFVNTLFDCEVCYDNLIGQHCIKFQPCGHVFCRTCTHDYFRSLVKGIVSKPMECLAEKCVSQAQQSVIREALGEELFAKYETELLDKVIREMDDTVDCPRETCQKVAYITDRERNLGECSYCQFSFCVLCKQTFHGISGCKWKKGDKARIIKQWQEGEAETRAKICRQFGGEKHAEMLVERFLNEEWLESNSKPCPKCSVSIEKNEGCHKMHCTKCDTYFCWLCSEQLSKNDPYQHFQGEGLCSGRLFEGVHHVYDDEDEGAELLDYLGEGLEDETDYEDDDSDPDFDDEEDFVGWRLREVVGVDEGDIFEAEDEGESEVDEEEDSDERNGDDTNQS